ncbi:MULTISPECIES: bifunctional UDP-sugar hydrolase/5'-nucleotidase UshA [Gammaproteobacteria]|uniref:bifunctional UDP-sugar hydrolase/5'-nucleotidase UshA n=1 Tax=Gammaproteobacteria TaxID=1236 RepID=UPI001ADCF7B9|nr:MULTISPECIES: bifunctional UDP-sugar hydrolase/5'-nucleotidase UshA [Gammaproteobacteria]MBO9482227.1 bifunctional UDP-sugar hydrolase/5'-nucleotidase [Salinisphaera sp. G21_0]MBO9495575.1 bifunctional UDP-sugar hydrolase/5'-nucleotidase [Thalassotalea sp. G20_0]
MLYPRWLLLSFPILLLLSGCATDTEQYREPALKTLNFTIIHTNDNHGKFWRNRDGEVGMAARKTLIDRIRAEVEAEGGKSLVLSAGDINTGVPESDIQQAEPDFIGMNLIGYDAMTVGNHEFDNPLPVLLKQEKWADFPFLSANIFYKDTGKLVFKPWVMKELEGVRVAILGLTTEDTESQALKENIKDLRFDDAVDTGKVWVPKLIRDDKADIVIALTHMGHYPNAKHGPNAPGDVSLAKEVDGVDIIVGGHSQTKLLRPDIKNSTYVLQAWEWGKYVGRADFIYQYLDNGRGHSHGLLKMVNYRLIPVNLKKEKIINGKKELITIEPEIPEDPAVLKALKPYQDKASELMNRVVGAIDQSLDGSREKVRSGPAAIGNLIARAQMEKTKADLAVMNGGGIRTGLKAGKITEKDLLKIQPFGNMVCYLEMTGRELRNYIEDVAAIQPISGGMVHFANVRLTMAGDKLMSLDIGGKPVDKNRKYRMAINAFSASGGDNWPVVDENPTFVNTGYTDAVVLSDYVKRYSPLKRSEYLPKGKIVRK